MCMLAGNFTLMLFNQMAAWGQSFMFSQGVSGLFSPVVRACVQPGGGVGCLMIGSCMCMEFLCVKLCSQGSRLFLYECATQMKTEDAC